MGITCYCLSPREVNKKRGKIGKSHKYSGERMENTMKQLNDIGKELTQPFPYEDMEKIQEDFQIEFLRISNGVCECRLRRIES